MQNEIEIRERLTEIHGGDDQQLKVIFSKANRVIVEAPAGYGKTMTMVSRIAYLYTTGRIPNPKQILGLTFSVNAALKIKRDVSAKLPILLGEKDNPISISDRVCVTNFHGFCKSILRKYGWLLSESLKCDINLFKAVGKYELEHDKALNEIVHDSEKDFISYIDEDIENTILPEESEIDAYIALLKDKLLPARYVTHTGIILMVLVLFKRHPAIRDFYRDYYPLIIVDEFQDTNSISWKLLQEIIGERSQLLFLGDSLQRIYGFIGALPGIMDIASEQYQMERIPLIRNYRFRDNPEMLKLDANIRNNAKKQFNYDGNEKANLEGLFGCTQEEESELIAAAVQKLLEQNEGKKVAILLRGRGKDVEVIQESLNSKNIRFFYGMFKDDDDEYITFHITCQNKLLELLGKRRSATNYAMELFERSVRRVYQDDSSIVTQSLLQLLHALLEKIKEDYKELLPEERFEYMLDVLENRQLKQAMEYIDSSVILSTIHGAKGLEWDFVIIAGVERWVFPSYICRECTSRFMPGSMCRLPRTMEVEFVEKLLDELSVFYVGVTRARIQTYIAASGKRYKNDGTIKDSCYSCFSTLDGIRLVDADI